MKTTIITSAAALLTVAAATPTTRAGAPAGSVAVPVLAPSSNLMGVAPGATAAAQVKSNKDKRDVAFWDALFHPGKDRNTNFPGHGKGAKMGKGKEVWQGGRRDLSNEHEHEHEHEHEARGIPAALHNWDPYGLERVPKLTLTTPAPTPKPTIILSRGEEDKGLHSHGHGANADAKESAEKVISVVIGSDTILIPQEGVTTVHHRRPLARPTNIRGGAHRGANKDGGELVATVIQDGVSTVLPIGLQPTVVPLGKRCDAHGAELVETSVTITTSTEVVTSTKFDVTSTTPTTLGPSPTVPPKEDKGEEEGGDEKEGGDKGDDKGNEGKEDDKVEDKDDKEDDDDDDDDDEEELEANEIVVHYGEDTIYVPLEGPVSISYGPKEVWTDFHSEAPHTVIQTATVVQNGWSVTLAVSDLARALPIGKTIPVQYLHPTTTTTDEGDLPMVTGYPPEWRNIHSRLAITTSSDIPVPAATIQSLPKTFVTAARPTPHKLHGEHDREDTTF